MVDLNCDMGESFGIYTLGLDEEVMPLITSANIACGFHAGDPQVLRRTVELAAKYGVAVGAHVSYPDLVGFGRRAMAVDPTELENDLIYQMGAIQAFCKVVGVPLRHVKPHGALYNTAQRDRRTAEAVARAVASFDPNLLIFAQSGSVMAEVAREAGLRVVQEVFADRAYTPEGQLVSRRLPGAVIHDAETVAQRALEMVTIGYVTAVDGSRVPVVAESICVHGDTPDAVNLIRRIRERLEGAGVVVGPAG
ncbi:MAG TPA: 5-oxoprolinase subunit PxpA [Symbiobacteriaceae bacterium]